MGLGSEWDTYCLAQNLKVLVMTTSLWGIHGDAYKHPSMLTVHECRGAVSV